MKYPSTYMSGQVWESIHGYGKDYYIVHSVLNDIGYVVYRDINSESYTMSHLSHIEHKFTNLISHKGGCSSQRFGGPGGCDCGFDKRFNL